MSSSNFDRYRPPREGFQPPAHPPKPPFIAEHTSQSPGRRREVPPAVPSPPVYSSRTSPPPRPQSRRSAPSPAMSSPQRSQQQRKEQWLFTVDEVKSSPSIIDGLPLAEERLRRAKGVHFIFQAGVLLELPQITLWVAAVFFHRFYMRYSMVEQTGGIHHYNIAATSLFLANKTEENCRKTKDLIIAVAKVAQKNTKLIIDEQSKEYWRWRDSILAFEELMLETLTFDLMIDNPYRDMYELLGELDLIKNHKLRDGVWAFCNDASLTALPLILTSREVAISAIFFAATVNKIQILDVEEKSWWAYLGGSEEMAALGVNMMCEFYRENPLRKQDKCPPSPEFRLESTRRRGDVSSLGMDVDSPGAMGTGTPTPVGTERAGTQSPGRMIKTNGNGVAKAEESVKREESVEEKKAAIRASVENGDSDAALKAAANEMGVHESTKMSNGDGSGLVSPGPMLAAIKRKSAELEDPVDAAEREAKKIKLQDEEDEGEIKGS
ncbi:putative cyclin [Triangularia verruculosa]|uniref:RNA polymerase II holoenzyme cyclin-like subunit n=1 Tax=Triangularia verruculosa TaxID=2587418 RepID=A0AAN6XBT8_9PEZI|nr:putative cyclin [Triangularia verruculosa]